MIMAEYIFARNASRNVEQPPRVRVCGSFASRLRGLMFHARLAPDEGILLDIGRDSRLDASIHMFFVPFELAVIWAGASLEIVDTVLARPWRPAYIPSRPARYVLEVHPDMLGAYAVGEKLEFVDA